MATLRTVFHSAVHVQEKGGGEITEVGIQMALHQSKSILFLIFLFTGKPYEKQYSSRVLWK